MSRFYTRDGQRYPSVTTILSVIRKPALEHWRGKHGNAECDRLSKVATDLGTKLHCLVEGVNLALPAPLSALDPLYPMVAAYTAWCRARLAEVVRTEQTVVCRCHSYAGTADAVLRLRDGRVVTTDYKTSRAAWPEHGFQLAAYRHALLCDLGIETDTRRLVLRFDKERPGLLEEHWYDDDRRDFRAFLAASIVWHTLNSDASAGTRPVLRAAITPGGTL